jgi:hypothetical protein
VVEENELLGSAGTILKNRRWIDPDDCFWSFYAHLLQEVDFSTRLRRHESRPLGSDHWRLPRSCSPILLAEFLFIQNLSARLGLRMPISSGWWEQGIRTSHHRED